MSEQITAARLKKAQRVFEYKKTGITGWIGNVKLVGRYGFYGSQNFRGEEHMLSELDAYAAAGYTCLRDMTWPTGTDIWPVLGTQQYYERRRAYALSCLERGIVPIMVIHPTYDIDGPKRGDYGSFADYVWSGADMAHSVNMAAALEGLPVLAEIGNEVQKIGVEWQQDAVKHWKSVSGISVMVSTGFGTGGMSENSLELSGAHGHAWRDVGGGYSQSTEHHNHDGDHSIEVNSTKYSEGFNDVMQGHDDGSPITLSLIPYQDDPLPYGNWKVEILPPDNQAHNGRIDAMAVLVNDPDYGPLIKTEAPPPPWPDPPTGTVDVVNLIAPPERTGFYLDREAIDGVQGAGFSDLFHDLEHGMIWDVKNRHHRAMWDVWWYDDHWIYLLGTTTQADPEARWFDVHVPGTNITLCPRFLEADSDGWLNRATAITDTGFRQVLDCGNGKTLDLLHGVGGISGPFAAETLGCGGNDIHPDHPCYKLRWDWNNQAKQEEYAMPLGIGIGARWHRVDDPNFDPGPKNVIVSKSQSLPPFTSCEDLTALVMDLRNGEPWTKPGEVVEPPNPWEGLTDAEFLEACYDEIAEIRKPPPTSVKNMRAMQREWVRRSDAD